MPNNKLMATYFLTVGQDGEIRMGWRSGRDFELTVPLTPSSAEHIAANLLAAAEVSRGQVEANEVAYATGRLN